MSPFNQFFQNREKSPRGGAIKARMTWASKSVSKSIRSTGLFLRRNVWLWPIIAVIAHSLVGYLMNGAIESTMKENLRSQLQTLLDVEVAMLRTWFQVQESTVQSAANSREIRDLTKQLLEAVDSTSDVQQPFTASTLHREIEKQLGPVMSSHRLTGYIIADKSKRILSATDSELIGLKDIEKYDAMLTAALDGKSTVTPPFRSVSVLKANNGRLRTDVETMFAVSPIRDESFQVIAVLGLRIPPSEGFTEIMQLGRLGETGETFAFDQHGTMVSNSRFDKELMLLGLIPQEDDSKSMLTIQLRNPGGNMEQGYRPEKLRSELPLTQMVVSAINGESGNDVEGYSDYRGVPVVGAWTWLKEYNIGVATEMSFDEAYLPLTILRWTFRILLGLLIASSVAIFVFTLVVARLQREAQKAAIEARQIGQYELIEKLGQGAMGVVYKGHHAMLRRPTAIKMLDIERINDASIARFEREVQITCQLNNPSTIAIYDYGRTPEGVFYYAMEYLDGINLETLVDKAGPQPESRVIHLLLQICGSLYEAHSLGLVHRDIKPANIMLNRRGGMPDVIKVLDFGLVKALDERKQVSMTAANSLTGTPLYISPEGVNSPALVDARSDIYAVGAVAYFLLTGRPPFASDNIVELLRMHVAEAPQAPSQRIGRPVSNELESAILACLEKNPANRPQTARDLANLLRICPEYGKWTIEQGEAWWGRYERGQLTTGSGELAMQSPGGKAGAKGAPSTHAPGADRTFISNEGDEPE